MRRSIFRGKYLTPDTPSPLNLYNLEKKNVVSDVKSVGATVWAPALLPVHRQRQL